jgi:hypothetical protein
MGVVGGLALGLALVALLEYRDSGLRTESDVVLSLALPVLAVIPKMVTAIERRRARRRNFMIALSASASAVVLGLAVVAAWKLHLVDQWIR